MDPKTLAFGAAVVVASVGGAQLITSKPTTQLSVVAGGTVTDQAVTAIAKVRPEVDKRQCCLEREGTERGIELAWFCDGARMPQSVQDELRHMAGDDGSCVTFTPKLDGEKVVFDAAVHLGPKPNLDPVPVEPVKEEVKPAEKLDEKLLGSGVFSPPIP